MIEFGDNAATDLLLDRIGRARVLETAALLDVETLGAGVSPVLGALLTAVHDRLGDSVAERIRRLRALPAGERAEHAWRLAARYADAPEAALAGLAPALATLGAWGKQVALADALPWRGSARDLATLVGEATSGKALGRETARIMERQLSWPMADPTDRGAVRGARPEGGSHGRRTGARRLRATPERAVERPGAGRRPPVRRHGRRRVAGVGGGSVTACSRPGRHPRGRCKPARKDEQMTNEELAAEVAELRARVEALEAAPRPPSPLPVADLVSGLRDMIAGESGPDVAGGIVVYAGLGPRGNGEIAWQLGHAWDDVLAADRTRSGRTLAVLSSPARLDIVAELLGGPVSRQDLQDRLEQSTAGQLNHHLRELLSAGLVDQPRRGVYEVPPHRVIPILTVLACANDLAVDSGEPER
jgi:DNA-binding HxlR family transcriptional regulator